MRDRVAIWLFIVSPTSDIAMQPVSRNVRITLQWAGRWNRRCFAMRKLTSVLEKLENFEAVEAGDVTGILPSAGRWPGALVACLRVLIYCSIATSIILFLMELFFLEADFWESDKILFNKMNINSTWPVRANVELNDYNGYILSSYYIKMVRLSQGLRAASLGVMFVQTPEFLHKDSIQVLTSILP